MRGKRANLDTIGLGARMQGCFEPGERIERSAFLDSMLEPCLKSVAGSSLLKITLPFPLLQAHAEGIPDAVAVYVATAQLLAVGSAFGCFPGRRCGRSGGCDNRSFHRRWRRHGVVNRITDGTFAAVLTRCVTQPFPSTIGRSTQGPDHSPEDERNQDFYRQTYTH